ncbi:MAG: ATP-binding cassette domain-containing protein, partial [Pseudomonadota bacterium]
MSGAYSDPAANVGLRLDAVSYAYPVIDATQSLKKDIIRSVIAKTAVGGRIRTKGLERRRAQVMIQALQDISLNLKPGDRLGLLGPNGAGKTTLLRLMGGLIPPSSGRVSAQGRLLPLLNQGVGIQDEFTGRDNIELPLRLLGASDAEVAQAKRDIPDLIDLGSFLDLPVRTYSEGMRARLSFGISTFLKGDILLLDEWVGAGDAAFLDKANRYMHDWLADTGILVIATHGLDIIETNCNCVAVMDSGRIVAMGNPGD